MKMQINQFVIGWCKKESGSVVRASGAPLGHEGMHLNLRVDMSEQITFKRCSEIMAIARTMSGRDLYRIEIKDSEYTVTPGNECDDFAETCLRDKSYVYDAQNNCLTISDKGRIVYINEDGDILRGDDAHVAHADSLDI
jgi:hypothetical protein